MKNVETDQFAMESDAKKAEADAARDLQDQVGAQESEKQHATLEGHRAAIRAKFDEIKNRAVARRAEHRDREDASEKPLAVNKVDDQQMEDVVGGTVDIQVSSTLTTTLNIYINKCKSSGINLDGALAGLSSLGLSSTELEIAQTYVRQAYASVSF